jgi:hypothetical protein
MLGSSLELFQRPVPTVSHLWFFKALIISPSCPLELITSLLPLLLSLHPLFMLLVQPVLIIKIKSRQERTTWEKHFIGSDITTLGGGTFSWMAFKVSQLAYIARKGCGKDVCTNCSWPSCKWMTVCTNHGTICPEKEETMLVPNTAVIHVN